MIRSGISVKPAARNKSGASRVLQRRPNPHRKSPITAPISGKNTITYFIFSLLQSARGMEILEYMAKASKNELIIVYLPVR